MAKTQYSLSTDAAAKGVPTGFRVLVRDVRAAVGAGYIYRKSLFESSNCVIFVVLAQRPVFLLWLVKFLSLFIAQRFLLPNAAAICGDVMTIPGLPTRPGFYDVDIDTATGRVVGLF